MKIKVYLEIEAVIEIPTPDFVGMKQINADEYLVSHIEEAIPVIGEDQKVTVTDWEVVE